MATRSRHPLPDPPLQLITGSWRDVADLEARVTAAMQGGIRWVQLRAKERAASELYEAACRVAPLVREAGGLFIVNDRVDVAIASGAAGVHLPENGMPTAHARTMLGEAAWIGRSMHSIDAILSASGDPLDAIQFGPVFETASKLAFGAPQGLEGLSRATAAANERGAPPIVAVGGLAAARIPPCLRAGAAGVSIIGAIWDATDLEAAAREVVASLGRS